MFKQTGREVFKQMALLCLNNKLNHCIKKAARMDSLLNWFKDYFRSIRA